MNSLRLKRKQGVTRTAPQATSRSCGAEAQEHLVCSRIAVECMDNLLGVHQLDLYYVGAVAGKRCRAHA